MPARLADTRPGGATVDGLFSGTGMRPAGSVLALNVAGRAGVPGGAASAVLNVTVTGAAGAGFVTVYPCGQPTPNASNLNFVPGQTVPNAVVSKLGSGGQVCLFTSQATHLIVDVGGYFPTATVYVPLATPARLLDSRPGAPTADGQLAGIGLRPAGSVTELPVLNRAGVPTAAGTVVLNVTATGATGAGFVTVFPCGQPVPNASNLNFEAGATVPNAVVATVGAGGKVCLFTSAATHLLADAFGTLP